MHADALTHARSPIKIKIPIQHYLWPFLFHTKFAIWLLLLSSPMVMAHNCAMTSQPSINYPSQHVRNQNIEFSNFVFTPQISVARIVDAKRRSQTNEIIKCNNVNHIHTIRAHTGTQTTGPRQIRTCTNTLDWYSHWEFCMSPKKKLSNDRFESWIIKKIKTMYWESNTKKYSLVIHSIFYFWYFRWHLEFLVWIPIYQYTIHNIYYICTS